MSYLAIGFICGFFIPYVVRRYLKIRLFEYSNFVSDLYWIFKLTKRVSKQKRTNNLKYKQLHNHYLMRSIGWGIFSAAIFFLISLTLPKNEAPWIAFLVIILFTLSEIDKFTELLPDILTYPLLLGGFAYAAFAGLLLGENNMLSTTNSALGAIIGYTLPIIASLLLVWKHRNNFGGGDIKLLTALGAWFGVTVIPYIIVLSCPIFGITCLIKKQKAGPYGPSIVLSALIILFILIY